MGEVSLLYAGILIYQKSVFSKGKPYRQPDTVSKWKMEVKILVSDTSVPFFDFSNVLALKPFLV